ncbi:SDR family NAD(P)-dependent oxidoreductase [Streptomyces malaysiensis subsp. malaysiensis]|uniref:SDR family NAD(P)-dependent oxidoreductase n=3 Tax=Streptomyces malaysiensis TaxID=92644 RepID=A0ABX6WFR3_STRMQ|nr:MULTISPECIES: type I polyketide synthase [Streptomyces]QPI60283.1 SDR family NAD(P)-dependent oxidoreductase [Streptomyces solisilvae]UHH21983.1 SDR family NAD(P)-dependent oxidoreductase [Streptomyces sp. HNM0561]
MSGTEEKLRQYLKKVTADLGQTRRRLREMEERSQEPVAIVSMACRYPGGITSPEELWELVASRGDAIGEFPNDRGWQLDGLFHPDPDHFGTSYVRHGGFLDRADGFDAAFFGISPREALAADPQQRQLLEVAWELIERAGIDPTSLKGTATGVYAGAGILGFGTPQIEKSTEGFLLTGNTLSVVSGRVAFTLGLEGPAVTVDTACSSSLVAMHLACQALRQGECTLALAGGVTVMTTPNTFVEFSRQRGLAPDGRCKPFAAAADGTGFSEGVGLLLLERLSDAQRNGHQVLAVIRGSAINQDGASNGLTAPNGPSQQRVIRQALINAQLSSAEVDAVEAHGTGTTLGDPIEAEALLAAYGQDRAPEQPLWLGSLKSNIGHAQGAAGVAGVIKMVMALRHELLPATLYVDEPTPHADWSSGAVRLLTDPVEWPRNERPRRAGVSAFGISGTNAHVIVEQAPEEGEPTEPVCSDLGTVSWVLSARSAEALRGQAAALVERVGGVSELSPVDVGWSLVSTRSVFEHRAVVVGEGRGELLAGLEALAGGVSHAGVVRSGTAVVVGGVGPVLVFPGQGSQWVGMGAGLLEVSPVFAARVGECERALSSYVDWSLTDVLRGAGDLGRVDVVQPVLWAVMVSLAAVWAGYGVRPVAVVGHSQGEIAAAVVAGALSLEDGAKVVALRSKALRRLAGGGAMASLGVGQERAGQLFSGLGDQAAGVGVAAVNGPSSTVVSGPPEQVAAVVAACAEAGERARLIEVDYASHGPQVDEIRDELNEALAGVHPLSGGADDVAFYSTVTGGRTDASALDSDYWVRNLRERVRFADAVEALLADGHRVFIEASTHPVLTLGMEETFEQVDVDAVAVPTLRRDHGGQAQLLHSLGQAFIAGVEVDWKAAFPVDPPPRTVDLPTYAFQHQRYWMNASGAASDPSGLGLVAADHPLLGAAVELADGSTHLLTGRIAAAGGSGGGWLGEHIVANAVLAPGAALVEWALRAADEVGCGGVEELTLQVPLVLTESGGLRVQVVVGAAAEDGRRDVRIYSRPGGEADSGVADVGWVCHAEGVLSPASEGVGQSAEGLGGTWPPASAQPVDLEGFYQRSAAAGYAYGPSFQGVRAVWRDGADLLAEVALPEAAGDADGFGIHPALLDAALHPALLLDTGSDEDRDGGQVRLPFAWNGVSLWAAGASTVRVRLSPRRDGAEGEGERGLRLMVADAVGDPVLTVDSLVTRPAAVEQLRAAAVRGADGLFVLDWTPLARPMGTDGPVADRDGWAVLAAEGSYPDLDAFLSGLDDGEAGPAVVLAEFPRPDADAVADMAAAGLAMAQRALELVQKWLAEPRLADARLVVVTRGAVAVTDTEGAMDVAAAALWGLLRSAQAENPGRFLLLDLDLDFGSDVDLDVDRALDLHLRDAITQAVDLDEPQLAVRDGQAWVPRLIRASAGSSPEGREGTPAALDPDGTVLVTGGTGTLGGLVAEHLVRTWQVGHLLLVSRRGPDAPGARDLAARLEGLGARVRIAAVDVTDASAVADLVAGVDAEHPLTGVIHATGLLDDAVLTSQTPERLARVWAAKATGAAHLHTATADLPLALFAMFSSAAGVLGSPGQANYAAANAFCDALAAHRQAHGLPGLSVAWGLWARSSEMTGKLATTDRARMSRSGIAAMSSEKALGLLDAACAQGEPLCVAAAIDPAGVAGVGLPVVLRGLVGGRVRRRVAEGGLLGSGLVGRLVGLDAAARLGVVVDVVRGGVAVVLGFGSLSEVRVDVAFKELGFDSLTAVELRNRLSVVTGLRLPATLVFDYPTPRVLAEYLCTRLSGETSGADTHAPVVAAADADEPIAIVAMTCRFPGGVSSPEELWDLVASGRDAIGEFPTGRGWDLDGLFHPDPDHPGTSYARKGGFLYDADAFDAAFFGINPREALATDPQQRLLLEASWEVLERAGIDPVSLKGSSTGVYAGVMYHDYAAGLSGGDARLEGYAMLASSGSVVSGRVAYTLGFEGPAVTVDTACSSSLVAMHLAAQALRQGECTLALAGGVTVMATPDVFTGFSRQRGLAPDGRCKPFAAAADGTGWGEGVGVLLLERLSDAQRNGHDVLAVIRGSAVNQDGASNGLTAPNGPSQQRVIRQALASAGLSPSDVDAVEAHGTGTTLGDPIEAQALLATYGQERPAEQPLLLGSIKSNIGHAQAAAGVAGVIKMVQAIRHGRLPASLHIDEPSPHVDWASGAVRLLTEAVEWPEGGRPRRAGVSSFGASGTNAHLLLEQAPEPSKRITAAEPVTSTDMRAVPWTLSARSAQALRGQAAALVERMAMCPELSAVDVGWSLATTRSLFEHRAVALGDDRAELLAAVEALATGEPHPGVVLPGGGAAAGKTVWLFSGQGSQRQGMGAGLYDRFPVFATAFDEVCELLDPHLEHPLRDVVFHGVAERPGLLDHTTYAQAGLFALHIALARLLMSLGAHPDALIGHSIGEVAAAHIAGVFDLPDACRLVAARATLMGGLPEGGGMATVAATPDELADDLAAHDGQVGIAALNTPGNTVISGPTGLVADISATWAVKGRKTRTLTVSHAFHSPLMDPILGPFARAIDDLTFHRPTLPVLSNLTGEPADEEMATPGYWVRHIRQPVHFHPAVAHTAPETAVFLELGPDPVLATATQHTLQHLTADEATADADERAAGRPTPLVTATLSRKRPDAHALGHALAQLHTHGTDIDWARWFPADPVPRTVELPTYAFQRQRYWLAAGGGVGDVGAAGLQRVGHAHLPAAVGLADGGLVLTGRIPGGGGGGWLAEHVMAGAVLAPGAALVEWALRAADEAGCGGVEELALQVPLVLPASGGLRVQVVAGAATGDGRRDVRVYSRPDRDVEPGADPGWVCHAEGVLGPPPLRSPGPADEPVTAWPPVGAEPVRLDGFYEHAAASGYAYGPSFRGLRAVWRDGADLLAEVALPEAAGDPEGFGIHPALLDAALHPAFLLDRPEAEHDEGRVWLPFAWNGVSLWAGGATTVRVRLSPRNQDGVEGERGLRVEVADAVGGPVLTVDSLVMRPAAVDQLRTTGGPVVDGLFTLEWTPLPVPAQDHTDAGKHEPDPADGGGWAVLDGQGCGPIPPGAVHHPSLEALVSALDDDGPAPSVAIAYLPAFGDPSDGSDPSDSCAGDTDTDLAAAGLAASEWVLELVRGWLAEPRLADTRLVVGTRGAAALDASEAEGAGDGGVDVAGAAVCGLVRSAQAENPGRFTLLDLDPDSEPLAEAVRGAVTWAAHMDEPQIALRAGRLRVPRLMRAGGASSGGLAALVGQPAWRLELTGAATVENVKPVPCPEVLEPLGPRQVRVAVHAAGINFRDALISLGMVPGQTGLGGEGAGVVLDIGPEVTGLAVGDRVMGVFDRAFGPIAVTDARMVAPIPAGWTDAQAASVPVAFLTAWYGLVELGGLQAGESVLIHAATGGVGMAAVRIARHLGAEVYATASPGKHTVLEEMGIDEAHRASSRDLDFEEVFRGATGGRGVDVVLNSLAGPFVDASLRLLAESGRLMEMGKTDFRDPERVAEAHPGVTYQVYDLITDAGPERIGRMLGELGELFTAGALRPLPVRTWPLSRTHEALRHLSQAKHTGKLVLDVPAPVDPDGTVLITGGTGTLGALVAEHLVRVWRIGHLLLVSRRGPEAPGAQDLTARLTALGARVRIAAADVTDAAAVADLVAGVDPEHPLTGVIHAAGVLDDAVVTAQTPERLARVWAAKATAAAHLHTATARLRLGAFVLFSSAAGVMGSPGQANYAAANAFCDALAAHRRARGLPTVSVAWGLWAEASEMTGGLAEADLARMSRSGVTAMAADHALRLLDAAAEHGGHQLIAADMNPRVLAAQPVDSLPATLRALAASGAGGTAARGTAAAADARPDDWADRLAGLSATEQRRAVLQLVRGHVATVLGHPDAEAVQADTSFKELGFDSLTAVELRNRLAAATGLRLPAALVFDYPEAAVLADYLLERIAPAVGAASGRDGADPVLNELARLEATLIGLEMEAGDSGAVTARLESLLAKWKATRKPAEEEMTAAERLESASAAQVLDFIDNELGVS